MQKKKLFDKADMELASALNGSDRDIDIRSDLDSVRSY